jgi:hypothetical protein
VGQLHVFLSAAIGEIGEASLQDGKQSVSMIHKRNESETTQLPNYEWPYLEISYDFTAHDGFKFLRAYLSIRITEIAIPRHINVVGLGHVDAMVLQVKAVTNCVY